MLSTLRNACPGLAAGQCAGQAMPEAPGPGAGSPPARVALGFFPAGSGVTPCGPQFGVRTDGRTGKSVPGM